MSWVDWLLNRAPREVEDLNTRLEREATEAEKRVTLLEKEVEIRARLMAAKVRIKKAKRQMNAKRSYSLRMVLIVVVVIGVLALVLKDCGGGA